MSGIPRLGGLNPGDAEEHSGTIDSMPSLGMGELDSERGVVLRDWSAQDFSNIYVRFRPHLISHARKFLREESQAEEVVQDAFLYLMTALPELDSELGVLRFLKWKTKMLCLDVLRHAHSGLNPSLVPLSDDVVDESQLVDSLERADDAAVIRLALAKLSPRHREALIATIYEEKSHEEVAHQMGLEGNAFRQLLFRARAAFRRAFVGEAEVQGKSMSEILSIAARKNSVASKGAASALLLIVTLVTSTIFGVATPSSQVDVATPSEFRLSGIEPPPSTANTRDELLYIAVSPKGEDLIASTNQDLAVQEELQVSVVNPGNQSDELSKAVQEADLENNDYRLQLAAEFASALDSFDSLVGNSDVELSTDGGSLVFVAEGGLRLGVIFSGDTEQPVAYSWISVDSIFGELVAVPSNGFSYSNQLEDGSKEVFYAATDLILGDLSGSLGNLTLEKSEISNSKVSARIVLGPGGEVLDSELSIISLRRGTQNS